jgi:hypothetical protein
MDESCAPASRARTGGSQRGNCTHFLGVFRLIGSSENKEKPRREKTTIRREEEVGWLEIGAVWVRRDCRRRIGRKKG